MCGNSLRELIDRFVSYKKDNGYQYQTGAYYLERYALFVMGAALETVVPDKKVSRDFLEIFRILPEAFITLPRFCANSADISLPIGTLMRFLSRLEGSVSQHQSSRISSPREIASFFKEGDRMSEEPHLKGRHIVFPVMFRLLYCCELRCKEARTLAWKNIHLNQGHLDSIQSKGSKSRSVYISDELVGYLADYDRRIVCLFPDRKTFSKQGQPSVQSPLSGAEFPAFLVCCFSSEKIFLGKHPGV